MFEHKCNFHFWLCRRWLVLLLSALFAAPAIADTVGPLRSFPPPERLGHNGEVTSVAFSPDGRRALSGSNDSTLKLWNLETGVEIRSFRGHDGYGLSVAFSPDGHQALSGSSDNTLKLWDIETGAAIRSFEHSTDINSVAFSPDSRYALSGQDCNYTPCRFTFDWTCIPFQVINCPMKLFDIEAGTEIHSFDVNLVAFMDVNSVAFSPDGHHALSGSDDNTLNLWDIKTGTEIRSFSGHTDDVHSVAFSPNGHQALSGSDDGTLKLWNIETGTEIRSFYGGGGGIYSVAFSPDGRHALSGGWGGDYTLKLWEIDTGTEVRSFSGHDGSVRSVAFSPDGRHALSGSHDKTLKLWDIETGMQVRSMSSSVIKAIALSPDGSLLLSGGEYGILKLWDIETGTEIRSLKFHAIYNISVAFSPDGRHILSGSDDATLTLWEIETGTEIRSFKDDTIYTSAIAFSPDGHLALLGSHDKVLKLWDIETGTEIRSFEGHADSIDSVAFSPDGRHALSGSRDNTLKLWDIETGAEIRSFEGHVEDVNSVAFSPDGRHALSGGRDNTLKMWDIETGAEIRSFEGHVKDVNSVAFSPDGGHALSGSDDNTLKLWDIETGTEIRSFEDHAGVVYSVAFSPDGQYVYSSSNDRTWKEWESGLAPFNQPPQAAFGFIADPGGAPLTISLDAGASFDPDGGIFSYVWQIRGKTVAAGKTAAADLLPGTYEITLIVTDDRRKTAAAVQTVTVPPPDFALPAEIGAGVGGSVRIPPLSGIAVTWRSMDRQIAVVDGNGLVQGISPGIVSVRAMDIYKQSANTLVRISAASEPDDNGETEEGADNGGTTDAINAPGKAVLVAGGGVRRENSLFPRSEDLTLRMYRALKQRGYADADIFYLNPESWQDTDGDGRNDGVADDDLSAPALALENAFAHAASLGPEQQFVFYYHGHALPNWLKITGEYQLSAFALRELLDKMPSEAQQIVILDNAYAGSFLNDLAGREKRAVMAAAGHDENWNSKYQSFSGFLIPELRQGNTLKNAVAAARGHIDVAPEFFGGQQPKLADNYSGYVTLGTGNAGAASAPKIIALHEPLQLPPGRAKGVLWVRTSPDWKAMRRVRAALIPPGAERVAYKGEATDFSRREIMMYYNREEQRYETVYGHFREAGAWRVMYEVQGPDGVWSLPVLGEVRAGGAAGPVTVATQLNQSAYRAGDRFQFDLELDAAADQPGPYDLYAGIVFPGGYFITYAYPSAPGRPGEIQPYLESAALDKTEHFTIFNVVLPIGIPAGAYQACGAVIRSGDDPRKPANWLHFDCQDFTNHEVS
ncbi:MAG: hypothetical protein GY862_10315 [Gammaproteobacteria bacterium]|nr:hypothetical protein [Gammaproteobacteria bacterium]